MQIPLTIKETREGLIKKDFSATELVDGYLARIEASRDLNAYITISEEAAYKKADEIDKLIAGGDAEAIGKHALLGVTIGHKDLFLTKGIRTTAASKLLEGYIPAYSGTAVKRMDDEGGIILGKTNCDAWAH